MKYIDDTALILLEQEYSANVKILDFSFYTTENSQVVEAKMHRFFPIR
jgi:hypothetical protein